MAATSTSEGKGLKKTIGLLTDSCWIAYLYVECKVSLPSFSVAARGVLKNYNTIEDFKKADKHALFNQTADEVCSTPSRHTDLIYLANIVRFGRASPPNAIPLPSPVSS